MGEAVNNNADSKSELESKAPLSWRDCGGRWGGAHQASQPGAYSEGEEGLLQLFPAETGLDQQQQ